MKVSATAPDGVAEVRAGDDLAALLVAALELGTSGLGDGGLGDGGLGDGGLADGDVVVVTSKVVSKAEGRVVAGNREEHLAAETSRVVARRGPTTIVRTHHGLTLAAAGIDNSNVELGSAVLLPLDPDASARGLRAALLERTGRNVGVVVTDTAGRAWREGQTDIAIGAAGLLVAEDFAGRTDGHGNELAVTAPAVADEIAGLAELAQGKLGGRPFAVVRGRADLVLPVGADGPGAVALVRAEGGDLFGYGSREAVVRAVRGEPRDQHVFGTPVSAPELAAALADALDLVTAAADDGSLTTSTDPGPGGAVVAFAHGWSLARDADQWIFSTTP